MIITNYKYILTDLDFTLLDDSRLIPKANIEAAAKLERLGIKLVLASGRSFMSLAKFINRLNLNKKGNYAIGYNGGIIYEADTNNILIEHKLSSNLANRIIKECKKFDVDIIIYDTDKLIAESRSEKVNEYCRISGIEPIITNLSEYLSLSEKEISKILLKSNNNELKKAEQYFMASDISKYAAIFFSSSDLFEFNPYGIDKGSALEEFAELMNVSSEEIIAVGDNYNDIPMIERAGLGIAVSNAVPEAKAAADYVTISDNNAGVFKEIIEKFIL